MPTLDFADISGWTAFGVLAMLVLTGVMTGRLIPRRTHQDTIEERNLWRDAALTALSTTSKTAEVLTDARQAMRASTALIQAFPEVADDDDEQ